MADIQDFGEKIGGARKDLWKSRGILISDLDDMNAMERKTNIKKDNIWLKPDWEQKIADGTPQAVAYWQNKMRASIPPRPPGDSTETQENYVEVVRQIRDAVMAVKTPYEIDDFYKSYLGPTFTIGQGHSYYVSITPEASGIVTNKVLKAAQSRSQAMKREAEKKLFGIPKDEKTYVATKKRLSVHTFGKDGAYFEKDERREDRQVLIVPSSLGRRYYYLRSDQSFGDPASWKEGTHFVMDENTRKPLQINFETMEAAQNYVESYARSAQESVNKEGTGRTEGSGRKRKGAFVPPQLKHVRRTGPDYRQGRKADSHLFLEDLKFRGGEFGNWLNHDDRQISLDMAYDGLRDLARLLQMRPEDVSLNCQLAIAFGARGRGGSGAAAAHYEPDRQVINLTKMSGAGCLAHEWGHALDDAIGRSCGVLGFASENLGKSNIPKSFTDLMSTLKYKKVVMGYEELLEEQKPKLMRAKKNLQDWINSIKPGDLSKEDEKAWGEVEKGLKASVADFTGSEYFTFRRRGEVLTNPYIERLSQISKSATNHSIPRETKQQIAMWAQEVHRNEIIVQNAEPAERTVKTDFYKGSMEFDKIYSKHGHGYWQSDCEMFARAFDCYVADLIKTSGEKSDYLSARADSFVTKGENGNMIAAIPQGEERQVIHAKFDRLMEELKERGIIQDFKEEKEAAKLESSLEKGSAVRPSKRGEPQWPEHSEQLSLDDLIFGAESRRDAVSARKNPDRDISH